MNMSSPMPWFSKPLPERINMLNLLQNDDFVWGTILPSLADLWYPENFRRIVGGIAYSKGIGFDLAAPPYLAALDVCDHGNTTVRTPDGTRHCLSVLFAIGADSGTGKSRAVEEYLPIIEEYEHHKTLEIKKENCKIDVQNKLLEMREKELLRLFANSFDEEVLKDIYEVRDAKRALYPLPKLLANDVTSAAFSVTMAEQGYFCRLESDGVLLPPDAYRQVTKYWSGEAHRQTRISRAESYAKSPVIVDLLMTQTEFFREYVCNKKAIDAGLMARTLCYLYRPLATPQPARVACPMDEAVVLLLKRKLVALLEASDAGKKAEITLSPEAEQLYVRASSVWREEAQEGCFLNKISDFAVRMGQHAIRLAGLLWLSEHEVGCDLPIDLSLMQCAVAMTEVFAKHMMRARVVSFEDVNKACMKAAYEYILKGNFNCFPERIVVEKLRHKFRAEEVRIALYTLEQFGAIKDVSSPTFGPRRKGRPSLGREYVNVLYDPNGVVFD